MEQLYYLHPYFMSAEWYFRHDMRKTKFVYLEKIDGNQCSVVLYNEEKTEIIDGSAWYYKNELTNGYDSIAWEEIQTELDELWEEFEAENEETE